MGEENAKKIFSLKVLWENTIFRTILIFIFGFGVTLISINHFSKFKFRDEGYKIDLNNLQPLSDPVEKETNPLRVAIASIISPENSVENYQLLVEYLENELARPIEIVHRRTYAETNELLMSGEVDLAFVCTNAYVIGRREFGMQLLVIPQVDGETNYYSQLIVPTESEAQSIRDLKGGIFAFTDPISFSGKIYPVYSLIEIGESPGEFFQQTFYTYSHDDAINAVVNGLATGANVDSLVLSFAFKRDISLNEKIKIIQTSPPFGIPPVVVGPNINLQLQETLRDLFLNMHTSIDGIAALQALDIDKFVIAVPEMYDGVEKIEIIVQNQVDLP